MINLELVKQYRDDYRELYERAFEKNQLETAYNALGKCEYLDNIIDANEKENKE